MKLDTPLVLTVFQGDFGEKATALKSGAFELQGALGHRLFWSGFFREIFAKTVGPLEFTQDGWTGEIAWKTYFAGQFAKEHWP
jgi:hypothetical protein